ncbi:MAG: DUF4397 domain-containing protein [Candidatus Ventricola sp.]
MENRNGTVSAAPLPGPSDENDITPVVPLPNPGEGGAVFPGGESTPSAPPPAEGSAERPSASQPSTGGTVRPTPSQPSAGGPVRPTPSQPSIGGGVTIQPLPGTTITVPTRYAAVRFLNATHGYPAFRIFVDGTRVVNLLGSGTASGYVRVPAGNRTITVTGQDGYVYIEDVLPFASGSTSTVAIINRAGGLSLVKIADACRVI